MGRALTRLGCAHWVPEPGPRCLVLLSRRVTAFSTKLPIAGTAVLKGPASARSLPGARMANSRAAPVTRAPERAQWWTQDQELAAKGRFRGSEERRTEVPGLQTRQ